MEARQASPYRQLSYQLFGLINGPSVDMMRRPANRNTTAVWNSGNEKGLNARCLICYSSVDELDVKRTAESQKENSFNLFEFLGSLVSSPSMENLEEYLDECGDIEKSTTCHHSSSSGPCSCVCLCQMCSSACAKYLLKQRTILKLTQEANELKGKFIAAIQLSSVLALQESKITTDVKQEMASPSLKTVNAVRECVLDNNSKYTAYLFDNAAESEVQGKMKSKPLIDWTKLKVDNCNQNVEEEITIASSSPEQNVLLNSNLEMSASEDNSCPGTSTDISLISSVNSVAKPKIKRGRGRPKNPTAQIKPKKKTGHQKKQWKVRGKSERFWQERDGVSYYMGMEIKKNGNDVYLCPLGCADSDIVNATTRLAIVRHINKYHAHGYTSHQCGECQESFFYKIDLNEHKRREHGGEHACHICGLSSFYKNGLMNHIRIQHQGQSLQPRCSHCNKRFKSKLKLLDHKRKLGIATDRP